jgi:outer membrane protein assembly factor BamB
LNHQNNKEIDLMPFNRCLMVLFVLATPLAAEDWPQWLGPRRDSSSTDSIPAWKEAPKVLWRIPVGEGHSSPIVAGNRLYLLTKVKNKEEESVTAYDIAGGKEAWSKSYERGRLHDRFVTQFGVGPRSTPALHGGKLFTLGVNGHLNCWTAKDGTLDWTVDTGKQFSPPPLLFGVSCSPLIEGKKVLVNIGGKGASLVAFNIMDGKVVWKGQDDRPSYSSPAAFGEDKERQVVFLTHDGLVSVNPKDGSVFWRVPLVEILAESSTTPVKASDILLGSSVTFGSLGVQLKLVDGKPKGEQVWKNGQLTCYFGTPVALGEHLYVVSGSPPPFAQARLHCVDSKTGKILWTKDKVGTYHATLLRTGDDRLLMLDDFGNLILLEPNTKEYRELARSKVCGKTWAHPALSNGRLYLRDEKELICLRLASK